MKDSSRLNYLILTAFVLAAVAYLIYRYVRYAEERDEIYGSRPVIRDVRTEAWHSV